MKLRLTHLLILLLLGFHSAFAQNQQIEISGRIVDGSSELPVEFATVVVLDSATRDIYAGTTTDQNGNFELSTDKTGFQIEVSFIGYEVTVLNEFSIKNFKVELGLVSLSESSQLLDEVVVRAEQSQTEFKLDKRVFNVGKDLSTTGASALEVLNNVPSVNVSIEGDISLRGSQGVQILINGKPSVIASEQGNTLGTITADMIEKIEVITNPSAKYDAEGTAGILNIVIKKEERKGMNGSVSVNTGIPDNHSVGLSINRRSEKFNVFSQLGVGYREMPSDKEVLNRDLINNTSVYSEGKEFRNEAFYNVILGTDYHINEYNVLTLSGNFAYEVEDQPSHTDFSLRDADDMVTSRWSRSEITEATNPKYRYELQYKKDYPDSEDHALLFSALGNFFGKDQSSEFSNQADFGSETGQDQQTRTNFGEVEHTFKLDYTKPYSEKWTLETGAQYEINDVRNDYAVNDFLDGVYVNNPNLTNVFEWDQKVLGVYSTGAYEGDKWGIKVGLRVENTDLKTLLINTNERNEKNNTNLFPTLHTSYKLSESFSLQAGYSRRIFRPRMWDLNPFFNIRNNFSVRTGNPDLLPEFTDSYELNGIWIAGELSMNFGVYHRFTTDVVERISTFENNVNTVKPYNLGTNQTTGLEMNAKINVAKWMTLTGDANFNFFNRLGTLETQSFDFSSSQWSGKATTKIKLPAGIDFEMTGHYESKVITVQSEISEAIFLDVGLRKKIMKGRGVFSVSVRDLFASRVRESFTQQPEFYLYNRQQRGRFLALGFSYGFGKGDAMEYSGQKRRR